MQGDPGDFATLISFGSIGEAHVAAGLLDAAGIECRVPDENAASTIPHAAPAMGGYRLQVRREDFARARAVLADDSDEDEAPGPPRIADDPDDARPNPREAAALRAWKAAVIGWILLPVVLHLYSLWHLSSVLRYDAFTLSAGARRRAWIALFLDVLALAAGAFVGLVILGSGAFF